LHKVEIATEKNILLGRDEDRKKISMVSAPLTEEDIINQESFGNNE
jgi:NADH-quinone oxidoreductase subunit G